MKFLRERETPNENIAFMGISAGVVVGFSLLCTFLPLSSLFVILFLPLICALTTYFCKDKYLPFYVIGSIVVSLLCTVYNISTTLFDVVPAIIIGSLFGFFLKKEFPLTITVFFLSLLKVGLNYLTLLLLKLIYGIDFIETIVKLLNLQDKAFVYDLVPTFMFIYALIQIFISLFIISIASPNLIIKKSKRELNIVLSISSLVFLFTSFGIGFVLPWLAYFLAAIGVYLSLASTKDLFRKNPWWLYMVLGILLFASFYIFAFFYAKLDKSVAPLLFLTFFVSISLCSCVSSLLFKESKGGKE